jgi:hypothetical protein
MQIAFASALHKKGTRNSCGVWVYHKQKQAISIRSVADGAINASKVRSAVLATTLSGLYHNENAHKFCDGW